MKSTASEPGLRERDFSQYDVVRTTSHQMLEGVTISVAIGKGLNPAPLLKMTVFTFMACFTFFRFLSIPVINYLSV